MRTRSLLGTLLLPIIFSTPVVFADQIDYTFTVSNVDQSATRVTCPPAGGDCVDEELVISAPAYPGPVDINGSFTVDHGVQGEFTSPYGQDPQTASVGFPAFPFPTPALTNYQLTVNGSLFTQEGSLLSFNDQTVDVPPEWWGEFSPQDGIRTLCIKSFNLCTTPDVFSIIYDGIPLTSHEAAIIFTEGEETGFNFFPDAALADDLSQPYSSAMLPPVFPPKGAENHVFRMTFRSPDINGTFINYVLQGTLNVTALNGPPEPSKVAENYTYTIEIFDQKLKEQSDVSVEIPLVNPLFDAETLITGGFTYDPSLPYPSAMASFLCDNLDTCVAGLDEVTNLRLEMLGQVYGGKTNDIIQIFDESIFANPTSGNPGGGGPYPGALFVSGPQDMLGINSLPFGVPTSNIQFEHEGLAYEVSTLYLSMWEGDEGNDFFPDPPATQGFPVALPPEGSTEQYAIINFRSEEISPGVTRSYSIYGFLNVSGPPTPVAIDVDPWSETNEVLTNSDNPIPVAVFSSSTVNGDPVDLDTGKIDPATLKFGVGEAPNVAFPWPLDYNGDANTDVAYVFKTQASGIFCEDTEVTLTGETYSGEKFEGTGSINATDCETGFCHPL